jgi:hypothetical protein
MPARSCVRTGKMSPSLWLPRAWHARSRAAPRAVRRIKAGARALRTVNARRHQLIAAARSSSQPLPAFRRCVGHDQGAPIWSTAHARLRATSDDGLTRRMPGCVPGLVLSRTPITAVARGSNLRTTRSRATRPRRARQCGSPRAQLQRSRGRVFPATPPSKRQLPARPKERSSGHPCAKYAVRGTQCKHS